MSKVSIGDVYGRLTVVGLIQDKKNPKAMCVCECGNTCTPQRGSLKNGRATSCGCRKIELLAESAKTHGMSKTPTYRVWEGMLSRCRNSSGRHYHNYGGRGIDVHYSSFEEFVADVGEKPDGCWIDRIDNNDGYRPGNCRWVQPSENHKNKRVSKVWVIDGVAYDSSSSAASALGIDVSSVNRGCNGYTRGGKEYPPRSGWSCFLKYQ